MGPEQARWIHWLFRVAGRRASEAELGDLMEEYETGERSPLWLCRQVLSTARRYRPLGAHEKGGAAMLSNIWRDVRYALRAFRRNPGFAVAAVAPIALGIGINTGVFSILNSAALRPLPVPDSGELVSIHQRFQGARVRRIQGSRSLFSIPEYRAYRDGTQTLSGLMAYLPAGPPGRRLGLLVRSRTDLGALVSGIRTVTRDIDPAIVARVGPLEQNLDFWRAVSRLTASLSGSLGLLALTLASLGVYGVVSYVVSRRVREVGIRMMLGASARDVQRLILRQTLRPVVIGAAIGVAGAAGASRILQSVLFGVSPFDPIAFIGAPLFLLTVATAASVLPARQALKREPMTTLRYD